MRKILISVLVCLLLIGSAFFMVNGISGLNIKGIKGLDEKNSQVEQKITELSNVISITYANNESKLKKTANTLQDSKTEYENQAILSKSQNPTYASQLETYDIDYLWTKLGNYARNENVVIKIDLVSSGTSQNLYNLNFAIEGEYINITNFIYDIENDSKLGFKIDDFKMSSGNQDNMLSASFTCKEIPINVGTIDQPTSENTSSNTTSSNSTENTTNNTTNTSSDTNTVTNSTTNTNTNSTVTTTNSSATTVTTNASSQTNVTSVNATN